MDGLTAPLVLIQARNLTLNYRIHKDAAALNMWYYVKSRATQGC